MNNIKELMKQYEEVNAELNNQIKENGEEFITSLFQEIFDKHEGLNVVGIVGWTPGFNDGEPCTHSYEAYTGRKVYGNFPDFVEEVGSFEEDFEYDEEEGTHVNSGCKTLDVAFDDINVYSELFERIYYTNFRIVVKRGDDGKVSIDVDEFDCGY